MRELREADLKIAVVVSSSRNCRSVLDYAGITNLLAAQVDGDTALELHLPGKPAPDEFLEGARRLGVTPEREPWSSSGSTLREARSNISRG